MKVSVRKFQLNAKKYLNELPVTLTKYNVPIAKIVPLGFFPPEKEHGQHIEFGKKEEEKEVKIINDEEI